MNDHSLAALGDACTNLMYSLYLSCKYEKPTGAKVDGQTLSEAMKQAGLRDFMSSRVTRHKLADAAEALLAYAWLQNFITLTESVELLVRCDDVVDAFTSLLLVVKKRLGTY
ncbi:hypothetical protein KAS06_04550 [Candidatus Bathyarchaeota archaeon]|nr:hypothetical protein [Candidatus Bathyarchaeota archaeon]